MIRIVLLVLSLLSSLACAEDFLPPSLAFRPSVRALDGQTVEVRFEIAPGYYLYRDKFRFAAKPATVQLDQSGLPKGKEKIDETFGKVEVYYDEALIRVPVKRNASGPLPLTLGITSQGCAEGGLCYPPQTQEFSLELPNISATPVTPSASATLPSINIGNEANRIVQLLKHASYGLIIASFFGFGLLLSFTPCVFPMIPILSGIIVNSGRANQKVSHARGFALSLAYVLGMAISYALAGIAAGMTGTLLSSALQNVWVLSGFALLFVALAFSMFGFYELQMPAFLQSKVSEEASHFRGGSLPGIAIMGALSALIVSPCVAAPLAGALLYIGQTGNAILGGAALFCMALGMGIPLLVVGLSAGTLLPKSGPWMETVEKAFGFILLGTALWIVSPVIPENLQKAGWGVLLIVPALLTGAFLPLPKKAKGWQRALKFAGIVMLFSGAVLLIDAFSDKDTKQLPPQAAQGIKAFSEDKRLAFEPVRSLAELDARIKAADKPVMLDFYAGWCVECKRLARYTFSDERVRQALSSHVLLQADVTANSEEDKALLARFKLFGPPGIIFFDANGKEIENVRVVGYQKADDFLATLALLR